MITYVQWKFAGELIVCTTICICISFERLLAYFKKFTKKNKMSSSRVVQHCQTELMRIVNTITKKKSTTRPFNFSPLFFARSLDMFLSGGIGY